MTLQEQKAITKNWMKEFNSKNSVEKMVLIDNNGIHGNEFGTTFWLEEKEWYFKDSGFRLNGNPVYLAIKN